MGSGRLEEEVGRYAKFATENLLSILVTAKEKESHRSRGNSLNFMAP